MSSPAHLIGLLSALGVASLTAPVLAQWTVTDLHPSATTSISRAWATTSARQGGSATVGGQDHASLWTNTSASWIDLHPVTGGSSFIYALDGQQQAGVVALPSSTAALWSGTAASYVSLHPVTALYSVAAAARNGKQAGYARIGANYHASLWTGTAASWVDLHPATATASFALAIDGEQQAGSAIIANRDHASLWTGTAASWVDLHPVAAVASRVSGMHSGRQAGAVFFNSIEFPQFPVIAHASLWDDTAASWTDLHPAGAVSSEILAIEGDYQVGFVIPEPSPNVQPARASLWMNTAATWEDLSIAIPGTPGQWGQSYATSLWTDATTLYIAGYAENLTTGNTHALLWSRPLPPRCGTSDFNGDEDFGTEQDIEAFFRCLTGTCCPTCWQGGSDFNGDGDFGTEQDIEAFFRVLTGGNC